MTVDVSSAIVGLADLAQLLQSTEDAETRLEAALGRAHALLASQRTTLAVHGVTGNRLFACPPPAREEHEERVARLARLLREQPEISPAEPDVHSHLAPPLLAGDEELGMILVERHAGDAFDESSLKLLSVIASQLGAYLSRCLSADRERRQREDETRRNEFQRLLVGIVSHDLRTPLQAILIGTSVLRPIAEHDATILTTMANGAHRALRIINDLLDLTSAQSAGVFPIDRRTCDAAAITREAVAELRLAHPGRAIDLLGAERRLAAEIDPDRVAQALTNLVINAIQHGAPDHAIEVRVGVIDQSVVLAVRNRGSQIPAETLSRMFDPFHRGPRTSRGLGLGLYIVEQIVTAHGGRVSVESSVDAGTTFSMTLPLQP